ncbi:PhoH family protein [Galactobacter valiniphilus]|uniref:PhoH family protein n=1 Tax=Galactobacter valiniphilus TaxID=2676122 RepID=UPI003736F9B9
MTTTSHTATHAPADTGLRTFVVDTSVLIADPRALERFAEHTVVLPAVVISELEAKRHDPELGPFARRALRLLDDLRAAHGGLHLPIPVGDSGGVLRVELNHVDMSGLPVGFRHGGEADQRILAVAANLAAEGEDVVLVSKDLPLRLKASAMGLGAEEYLHEQVVDTGWTGIAHVALGAAGIESLYAGDAVFTPEADELPVNTGVIVDGPTSHALARVHADGGLRLVKGDREVFGVRGRSAEQRLAIDLLSDKNVGIVSLGGRAGTGKSALALCAGLEAVLERGEHKKIIVFRPLYAVGGQDLGYLPGSEAEKMGPWGQAVRDTLEALVSPAVLDEVEDRGLLEVLPLTHIRGRSLHDAFVIVDEAQSLERNVLLTVMTRVGQNARVVLTHDVAQRDNLHVGRGDGIAAIVETLKGHELFGHVTLTRSERSEVAALVSQLLDGALD